MLHSTKTKHALERTSVVYGSLTMQNYSMTYHLLLCPRQSPSTQHPPLLSNSTHPVPRTLTEGHTSRRSCVLQDTPENVGRQKAALGHNQRRASAAVSLILSLFTTDTLTKSLRSLVHQTKTSSLLHRRSCRRREHSPRVKTTGVGLGGLAGRSC
jgi:hypothetical protein